MVTQSKSTARPARERVDTFAAQKNLLLASLPDPELDMLLDHSEIVAPALRELFFDIGDTIEYAYFPVGGMASLVTVLRDDTQLEEMTVGHEGMMCLPLFHGIGIHRSKGMCQIEGEFVKIPAKVFTETVSKAPQFRLVMHRYAQFAREVLAQSAACNSIHLIEQRCARWLLTSSDAIERTEFNMTQELLSQMLAVRRPGVTVAMGALERQGLISHRYGAVKILDVTGLKKVACECYGTIHEIWRELFLPADRERRLLA